METLVRYGVQGETLYREEISWVELDVDDSRGVVIPSLDSDKKYFPVIVAAPLFEHDINYNEGIDLYSLPLKEGMVQVSKEEFNEKLVAAGHSNLVQP